MSFFSDYNLIELIFAFLSALAMICCISVDFSGSLPIRTYFSVFSYLIYAITGHLFLFVLGWIFYPNTNKFDEEKFLFRIGDFLFYIFAFANFLNSGSFIFAEFLNVRFNLATNSNVMQVILVLAIGFKSIQISEIDTVENLRILDIFLLYILPLSCSGITGDINAIFGIIPFAAFNVFRIWIKTKQFSRLRYGLLFLIPFLFIGRGLKDIQDVIVIGIFYFVPMVIYIAMGREQRFKGKYYRRNPLLFLENMFGFTAVIVLSEGISTNFYSIISFYVLMFFILLITVFELSSSGPYKCGNRKQRENISIGYYAYFLLFILRAVVDTPKYFFLGLFLIAVCVAIRENIERWSAKNNKKRLWEFIL